LLGWENAANLFAFDRELYILVHQASVEATLVSLRRLCTVIRHNVSNFLQVLT